MANRVLLGNRSTGGYGLYVSKEGQNVLTCADKELIFDSRANRTGLVYAGATGLDLGDSADNFLTTGSKASLGYPPLVVVSEKNTGERYSSSADQYTDQISFWKTTTSTITPATGQTATNNSGVLSGTSPSDGRAISGVSTAQEDANDVSYFVLRIPCAYGYMTSTYFG